MPALTGGSTALDLHEDISDDTNQAHPLESHNILTQVETN